MHYNTHMHTDLPPVVLFPLVLNLLNYPTTVYTGSP